ncbi:MarR family winged helix-turn-helix transcriptional regulator [Paraburkholderia sp. C35]|uniref:MarR family winged helix-turn-helix transcriptional regulator n=1 Tax=Paraburkholderia sp. C35 TaxID=2126993 RepID=UPI000D6980B6|nr:MarR family winged helix-turn-helix transcriptional regulator [Paraburkholderia sp. C35]
MHSEQQTELFVALLSQASRSVTRLYRRYLTEADLTPRQFQILMEVGRNPSARMIELAEALSLDRTTLVRETQPLLRRGYIEASVEARRRQHISLTPQGTERLEEGLARCALAEEFLESSFGQDRMSQLMIELRAVISATHD